jgi:erythromycin esterase
MHGAHEPLAFRNRLFRFLVERMGFTAIALESGFTESISARSFIEGGEGDAETAARTGLSSWANRYLENRELIQWMRDYNTAASSAGHRRVRLYGIDITAGARKNGPWLAIDSALTFLSRADPTAAQKIRDSLGDSLSGVDAREFGSLPAADQAEFDTSIEAIAKAMRNGRKSLIARSSDDEYRWALHNLDVARQLAKCLPITPPPKASNSLWARAAACRDSGMAENVQWAFENEGRQGRLLVFAHNGHVMSAKEDGRRMANVRDKPPMMGLHLRRAYGKDLYIITLVCATTSGGLLTAKPLEEGSIESTLAGVGLPLMFLDVRMARQNKEALTWLSTRRSVNANVSSQTLITLSTAVDAFLFVNTLTPAIVSSDEAP